MYGNPTSQIFEKTHNITPKRLFAVLEKCNLMTVADRSEAIRYLNKCREDSNRIIKVVLLNVIWLFLFDTYIYMFYVLSFLILHSIALRCITSYYTSYMIYRLNLYPITMTSKRTIIITNYYDYLITVFSGKRCYGIWKYGKKSTRNRRCHARFLQVFLFFLML